MRNEEPVNTNLFSFVKKEKLVKTIVYPDNINSYLCLLCWMFFVWVIITETGVMHLRIEKKSKK